MISAGKKRVCTSMAGLFLAGRIGLSFFCCLFYLSGCTRGTRDYGGTGCLTAVSIGWYASGRNLVCGLFDCCVCQPCYVPASGRSVTVWVCRLLHLIALLCILAGATFRRGLFDRGVIHPCHVWWRAQHSRHNGSVDGCVCQPCCYVC